MRTKMVEFVSSFVYECGVKVWQSAAYKFNKWQAKNTHIEVVSWQVCSTGAANDLTIVVEYRECSCEED